VPVNGVITPNFIGVPVQGTTADVGDDVVLVFELLLHAKDTKLEASTIAMTAHRPVADFIADSSPRCVLTAGMRSDAAHEIRASQNRSPCEYTKQ
jgi:hypothetical protein